MISRSKRHLPLQCSAATVQSGATRNLVTISNPPRNAFDGKYRYPSNPDIYIVDTGVYVEHNEFHPNRAKWGYAANGMQHKDGNGHGTHCAGIAAGFVYGVAKNANIIAVKVLDDNCDGQVSWVMAGLQWVYQNVVNRSESVVSMSLGAPESRSLDESVNKLINHGIQVVAAAGNSNRDCSDISPAHIRDVLTVGSVGNINHRSPSSNYGPPLNIWAPGHQITSAWITNPESVNILSGTSMAAPHASGVAALILGQKPMIPIELRATLMKLAWRDVVENVPDGTPTRSLLYNGGEKGIGSLIVP